jgi:hypothetical protein
MPKKLISGTAKIEVPEKVFNQISNKLVNSTTKKSGNISRKSIILKPSETADSIKIIDKGDFAEYQPKPKKTPKAPKAPTKEISTLQAVLRRKLENVKKEKEKAFKKEIDQNFGIKLRNTKYEGMSKEQIEQHKKKIENFSLQKLEEEPNINFLEKKPSEMTAYEKRRFRIWMEKQIEYNKNNKKKMEATFNIMRIANKEILMMEAMGDFKKSIYLHLTEIICKEYYIKNYPNISAEQRKKDFQKIAEENFNFVNSVYKKQAYRLPDSSDRIINTHKHFRQFFIKLS